ncbi:MAG TPA: hypothetical protein VI759_03205 [Dehalococcoidia bacterium]|nr:hypothetical protein [Dehalococcoidia bacterium]
MNEPPRTSTRDCFAVLLRKDWLAKTVTKALVLYEVYRQRDAAG